MNPHDEPKPQLDDPRVIEALDEYLAALESGRKPDRSAFLARHAEIAEALAECLEGIEALHAPLSALHDPLSAAGTPPALSGWQPGTMSLGDFRVIREVGHGGMGIVYEAEQLSLGRRIALKVLPFALTLDPRQLQRFKNEARAAAQLHHQHIVPVYYVGCERGVHFYAMQYIEGQSLAEVVQELRRLRRADGGERIEQNPQSAIRNPQSDETVASANALATVYSKNAAQFYRSAARLAIQAAEALEHAHEYGVVHRDIKPGNLLVDGHGHTWITDFGLAQFQADAGLTQTGDLLGTLRYMSPEQAGGQRVLLDHRTDIYSLGATLYELLTLQPPFDGADRQTLLRQILNDDPRPPRTIEKSIPIELETIVLKCLDKDAGRRYATVRDLANDLRRFLEFMPIEARRPSLLEKTKKWARRHRAVVGSALAILLLTVAGLTTATVLIAGAYDRERQKAREAEESFRAARRAVDQFTQISEEELTGKPFAEGLRKRMLEAALTYYQDFIDQHADDPSIRKELEETRAKVERIIGELTTLMGADRYMLLRQEAVQAELRLSDDQRAAIAEIERNWRATFHGFGRFGPERDRRRLAMAREQETKVAKILDDEQHRRFQQIAVQARGPLAFTDTEVIAALALTADQKKAVRKILDDAGGAPTFLLPACDPRGSSARSGGAGGGTLKKMVQLLTPGQKEKWAQLTGTPFEGKLTCGPPGFPRFSPALDRRPEWGKRREK
ncbi:MAG TPA: serine/threonine-protein kinase [Gemmataceae bacterium]